MRTAAAGVIVAAGLLAAACAPKGAADASPPNPDVDPYLSLNTLLVHNGCSNCHGVDYQRVGPALRDVASVYGSVPSGGATIRDSILNGVKGKYGTAIMPPQHQVDTKRADDLATAILALNAIPAPAARAK